MEIERQLQLAPLLAMKSFFLIGPRATGKTTIIHQQLAETATIIDLLDSRHFLRLSSAPHELESIIAAAPLPRLSLLTKFNASRSFSMKSTGSLKLKTSPFYSLVQVQENCAGEKQTSWQVVSGMPGCSP